MPALPTLLFHQPHPADGHAAVYGFAHVVNGEQRHAAGGEGFHFHAGLAGAFGGGAVQRAVQAVASMVLTAAARGARCLSTTAVTVAGSISPR